MFLLVFHFEETNLFLLFTVKPENYGEVSRAGLIQKFVNFNCLHTAWKTGLEVYKTINLSLVVLSDINSWLYILLKEKRDLLFAGCVLEHRNKIFSDLKMHRNIAFVKKCNNKKMCRHMNMHKIYLCSYICTLIRFAQQWSYILYVIYICIALFVMSKKISLAMKEEKGIKWYFRVNFPLWFID